MADANSTAPDNISSYNQEVMKIALEATWEIEGLATLIDKELHDYCGVELLAIRGIAKRIKRLNGAVMSALDEESDPVYLRGEIS